MNKNERKFLFELCKFKSEDQKELEKLISKGAATSHVLGELFSNRMSAVAYGVLDKAGMPDKVNREFGNSLKNSYIQNTIRNSSYIKCLAELNGILDPLGGKYALLKGAYLCGWYPEGYRTSNDIDILSEPRNITPISRVLTEAGFKQGYLKNNRFIPATREDIISSKMMRGETVPFIKEVNLPFMEYLEVDINYSLSYKNEQNNLVSDFISSSEKVRIGKTDIATLNKYDFMIHLCEHLYKEATTYPWIKMKRDMTLYKFCDIYALLCEYKEHDYIQLKYRIKELGLTRSCYYAVYITKELFSMEQVYLNKFLSGIAPENKDVLNIVFSPEDKKIYEYADDEIVKRFFRKDRTKLLKEVI